jgi:hypothetical protein
LTTQIVGEGIPIRLQLTDASAPQRSLWHKPDFCNGVCVTARLKTVVACFQPARYNSSFNVLLFAYRAKRHWVAVVTLVYPDRDVAVETPLGPDRAGSLPSFPQVIIGVDLVTNQRVMTVNYFQVYRKLDPLLLHSIIHGGTDVIQKVKAAGDEESEIIAQAPPQLC